MKMKPDTAKWTLEEDARLAALAGARATVIAAELGRSFNAVRVRLRQLGLRTRHPNTWSTEEEKKLRKLYSKKLPVSKIAEKLGRSYKAIVSHAQKMGVRKIEKPAAWTPREDALLASLASSSTIEQFAKRFGRSQYLVRMRFKELGIQRRYQNPVFWTAEKNKTLISLYPVLPAKEIAKKFGLPVKSVWTQAATLGLKKRRSTTQNWTPEADALLASLAATTPAEMIAEKLGRSLYAVRARLKQFDLRYQKPNVWSEKDKRLLKKLYPTDMPVNEIAKKLNRSRSSILSYAETILGLKKPARGWTPEMDAELKRLYSQTSNTVLSKKLGRSVNSILLRAAKFGLKKAAPAWIPEEKEMVVKLYPTMGTDLAEMLPGRTPKSIYRIAWLLGIKNVIRKKTEIRRGRDWTPEEDKILKEHYPTLLPMEKVIELVGRSLNSIWARAKKLGITRPDSRSPEIDAEIVRRYPHTHSRRLAEELGQPLSRVKYLAGKHRLKKENFFWTEEDEKTVAALYSEMDTKELSKKLKRPPASIVGRASKIGVQKKKTWGIADDAHIIRHYHHLRAHEIAQSLRKRAKEIFARANQLGLKKLRPWSAKDLFLLSKLYPEMPIQQLSSFLNRPQSGVIRMIKKRIPNWQNACVKPGTRWTKEEDAILRQLYPVVPVGNIAEFIGRSSGSVYERARKINLSRYDPPKENDLLNEFGFKFLLRVLEGIEADAHEKYGSRVYALLTALKGARKPVRPARREPGAMALALARAYDARVP
jgi:DNA-binding Lrp family transcriptional regulator